MALLRFICLQLLTMGSSGYLAYGQSTSYVNTFFIIVLFYCLFVRLVSMNAHAIAITTTANDESATRAAAATTPATLATHLSHDDFDMSYEGCGIGYGYCLGLEVRLQHGSGDLLLCWPESCPSTSVAVSSGRPP